MKRHLLPLFLMIFASSLIGAPSGFALNVDNPDPATWADDIDGSGWFDPTYALLIGVEFYDIDEHLFGRGSSLGFFFASDPATVITIFDGDDMFTSGVQVAGINFLSGQVLDLDEGSSVQDVFSGSGSIGFALTLGDVLGFALGVDTLYSVPSMNDFSEDLFGAFPRISSLQQDEYLLGFGLADPVNIGTVAPMYYAYIDGITPVPEPGTFLMLGAGCLLLMRFAPRGGRRSLP